MGDNNAPKDAPVLQCNAFHYVASPSIRVLVGEPDACMQEFFVHQSLISARSEFFAKALRGDWKEAQEREVPLPDDEAETFRLYLQLLYTNSLETKQLNPSAVAHGDAYLTLSKLYVLAEKLIDETAKTAVLAAMKTHGEERSHGTLDCPGFESINIIYNGTPDNSAARKWIIDMYAGRVAREPDLFPVAQELSHDFLADLYKKLIKSWPRPSAHEALDYKLAETEALKRKLAETEAEYLRQKGYARNRLQEEYLSGVLQQVQKLKDELRREKDSRERDNLELKRVLDLIERDNLKPESDNLKRKGDDLGCESELRPRKRLGGDA